MSTAADRAREIVYGAIAAVNEELPLRDRIEADDGTPLAGPEGALDSLRLINLIVHVEDEIEATTGIEASLTESEDLFDAGGPLASAGDFIAHLSALLDNGAG